MEAWRARVPEAEIFYCIGHDNVRELHTWRRYEDLRRLIRFVVFGRGRICDGPRLPGDRPPADRYFGDRNPSPGCRRAFHWLSGSRGAVRAIIDAHRLYHPLAAIDFFQHPDPTHRPHRRRQKSGRSSSRSTCAASPSFTDFFCSSALDTSEPQLRAIANELQDRLQREHGIKPLAMDGFPESRWIVQVGVVVHIFHTEKRGYYSLEDLGATHRG